MLRSGSLILTHPLSRESLFESEFVFIGLIRIRVKWIPEYLANIIVESPKNVPYLE